MKISRRDFLKWCSASAALAGVGASVAPPSLGNRVRTAPVSPMTENGILIDAAQCIGCKLCVTACQEANNLPIDNRVAALSPVALTFVDFKNVTTEAQTPVVKPIKLQCMHCQDPACVSVCPVGALYKKQNGAVAYDADKCIGCRYCMAACPFGIPRYDWNSPNPKINKCAQNCIADGKRTIPACVQVCPVKALYYDKRENILAIAKDRIKQNPDKYVNHIYGEKEVGGSSVLYLSAVPFKQLGFRTDLPTGPLPELTWNAQEKIPGVVGILVTLLSTIAWWTHRSEAKKLVEAPVPVTEE